jgi:hypothetical protein
MPRRSIAVHFRHGLRAWITEVALVVATRVGQIDATHERDIAIRPVEVANDHHFLMVGAPDPHSHVKQALAAGVLDLNAEATILATAEPQQVQMRPPYQPSHRDAT